MSYGRFNKAQYKKMFFDSEAVLNAIDKKTRRVLSKFGANTRTSARRLMGNKVKYSTVSKPGQPPRSHGTQPLKRNIFFGYDTNSKSVVIGPAGLLGKNKGSAPSTLEYGRRVLGKPNPRRRKRKIGDGGIVQVRGIRKRIGRRRKVDKKSDGKVNSSSRSAKQIIDQRGKKRWVTFAKLKTPEQVERSERLEEAVYGPMFLSPGKTEARPFMGPAMDKELANLPSYWDK